MEDANDANDTNDRNEMDDSIEMGETAREDVLFSICLVSSSSSSSVARLSDLTTEEEEGRGRTSYSVLG
jgi:hypothetical protein